MPRKEEFRKNIVLNYMKNNSGVRYSVKKLHKEVVEIPEMNNIAYSTLLKWVDVWVLLDVLKIEEYGNAKVIWWENE